MLSRSSIVRTLGIILLLSVFTSLTDACTCLPASRKSRFCNADFSFIGFPFPAGFTNIGFIQYRRYCFWVTYVFKPRPLPSTCVYTPVQAATCGTTFQPGQPYIVNGNIRNNRMHVNSCGWNERWSSVPNSIKNAMRNRLWCSTPDILTIGGGMLGSRRVGR